MDMTILSQINYIAVALSSLVFFLIGALWYSPLLFSELWVEELAAHNVRIQQPGATNFVIKMLISLAANIVASLAVACLVILTGSTTAMSGFNLGLLAAFGFAATTLSIVFNWEGCLIKLFLIDVGYPLVTIIVSAIILSMWR